MNYNRFVRALFNVFLNFIFHRHFDQIYLRLEEGLPLVGPCILVANHISWWDGFFLWKLQERIRPRSAVYTFVLEKEARSLPFFRRWLGLLPFTPGDFGALRAVLRHMKSVYRRNSNLVICFFPQGEIRATISKEIVFQRGIEGLCHLIPEAYFVPIALHIEALNRRKSSVFINAGPARFFSSVKHLQSEVRRKHGEIISELDATGEETPLVWRREGSCLL